MKNAFKKIILTIGLCMTMVSCGWLTKLSNTGNTGNNTALGSSMITSYTMNATMRQVDSICTVDNLPDIAEFHFPFYH